LVILKINFDIGEFYMLENILIILIILLPLLFIVVPSVFLAVIYYKEKESATEHRKFLFELKNHEDIIEYLIKDKNLDTPEKREKYLREKMGICQIAGGFHKMYPSEQEVALAKMYLESDWMRFRYMQVKPK